MKLCFVLLALCGLSAAAPQNWPYRDSLMPYRYGYPTQTQYKYLPQIEDDEDVGPYLGRQDVVVGSDGDRAKPTPDSVAPGVIETGSVAPVVEPTKAPLPVQPTRIPAPPPRPIGPDGGNRPVQPPVFPPARPPPTPTPAPEEDEEEDDESDEEEADDDNEQEQEGDDDGGDDDNNEEEEEEERRRQEPLNSDETVEVAPAVVADKVKPVVVPAPAPVVVAPVNKTVAVVSESSVEDVNATQVVESNEVGRPDSDDESSEEVGLGDGVEALVPGYVTDQGEVLVPVDTVSGDQPISIVPDPYSPPARGIPTRGSHAFQSHYDDIAYTNPYYYSDEIYDGIGRQDESEETSEVDSDSESPVKSSPDNTDDEDNKEAENEDEGPEARNEYLTAFPPSRTPELYALINSQFSSQASQGYGGPQRYQGPYVPQRYQGPYNAQRYQGPYNSQQFQGPYQQEPIIYRVRQQESNPSVSLAVRVTGGGSQYVNRFAGQQQFPSGYPDYADERYVGYQGGQQYQPGLRGPYNPTAVYRPQPQYSRPSQYNPYANYRPGPIYRPRPFHAGSQYPRPYGGPRPSFYGEQRPVRPVFRPSYAYGGPEPVFIKRRPIAASIRPVNYKTRPQIQSIKYSQIRTKVVPGRKPPTPVDYQDDEPYPFVNPFGPYPVEYSEKNSQDVDSSAQESAEEPKKVISGILPAPVVPKSRRAAKMAKKTTKKTAEKKKKLTDPDPLNILKKISTKRS